MTRCLKIALPMLVLAAALAVACGGGSSKTVKIPGGGEVSVSDKLPDSFPSSYPVYSGAKVKGSFSGTSQGITGTTVTWESGDSVSKVTDYYKNAFKSGSWKSSTTGQVNDSSYWAGESSDGKQAFYLIVSKADSNTSIILTVGDKPNDSSSSDSSNDSSSSDSSSSDESGSDASSSPEPAKLPDEVKISKDFPADAVPFPSGARVTSSTSFGGGGSQTYSVELYVKDSPEKVSDYFGTEMPKRGWTNAFTSNSNGEFVVTFSKENADPATTEAATISASESDVKGYTKVVLLVTSSAN